MKMDNLSNKSRLPRQRKIATHVVLACLSMAGLTSAPAFAQQAAGDGATGTVDTIVVTARKRNEKLLDVPISIIATSEKEIRASGTADLTDVSVNAGFVFNQYNGSSAAGRNAGIIVFRGLQGATALSQDASGSLFIDGVYVSSGQASVPTSDVARIEVMKGPQNAFFGRSTFGGAVNYVTKNPANVFQGEANATLNSHGSNNIDLSIEGPLKENLLKGRLTVVSNNKAAMYKASDGGDMGAERTKSVTGTLYLTPNDSSWIRFRGHYQQDNDSTAAITFLSATTLKDTSCLTRTMSGFDVNHNPITFTPGRTYFCNGLPGFDARLVDANTVLPTQFASVWNNNSLNAPFLSDVPTLDQMGLKREITRLSLQGGFDLPSNAEFAFNIGYNRMESVASWDLDRSASLNFFNIIANKTKDLTIDARVSSDKAKAIRGLVGVSRFTSTEQLAQLNWFPYLLALGNPGGAANAMAVDTNNYNNNEATVPAIYGSIDVDVTKGLTLSAEGRQQTDKITATNFTGTRQYTAEVKNFLPRLTAKFMLNELTSVYGSYAKGVQPLGLNNGYINAGTLPFATQAKALLAVASGSASEFTSQPKVETFELGIKQRAFDNRLQYAAAVYDQKWKDRQTLSVVFNPPSCPGIAAVTATTAACPFTASGSNVFVPNDGKIQGLEFSADAMLSSRWSANLNVDYKKTKWLKLYSASNSSLTNPAVLNKNAFYFDGAEFARVPKWQWSGSTTYRFPALISGMDGYVRGDVTYVGEAWDAEPNYNKLPGYTRANLRFGVEKKNMTLELFVKNLFDDRHWTFAARSSDLTLSPLTATNQGGVIAGAPEPRAVGIRTSFKF